MMAFTALFAIPIGSRRRDLPGRVRAVATGLPRSSRRTSTTWPACLDHLRPAGSGGLRSVHVDLGRSVIAGSLTMALLVLPIIIVASREGLRSVPPSIREASLGLGATQMADGAVPGSAAGAADDAHGHHPGAFPRDRRIGAADRDRRPAVPGLHPDGPSSPVHGAADPDFQLGLSTAA